MTTVDLHAEMTGVVAQFHIPDGEIVDKGETVLDVECMKSFFGIYAPARGIVRYKVQLGDLVDPGDLVATIEVKE